MYVALNKASAAVLNFDEPVFIKRKDGSEWIGLMVSRAKDSTVFDLAVIGEDITKQVDDVTHVARIPKPKEGKAADGIHDSGIDK